MVVKRQDYQTTQVQLDGQQTTLHDLLGQIAALRTQKAELDHDIRVQTSDYEKNRDEFARSIIIASAKLDRLKQELVELNTFMEIERRDIATRKIALDDREANLRRREQKADEKERLIQQNAALLDL